MPEHMTDDAILLHINRLVEEEKKIYAKGVVGEQQKERIGQIAVELDRCWDLLRQRRGLREFGRNPDEAGARPANVVENYKG